MDDIITFLLKRIPFYKSLGFEPKEIKDGKAKFETIFKKEFTQNGMIHGGVLASLIDSSCACAAFSLVYPDGYITTIDLQVQYLKPISKGRLIARAECVKNGKHIFFCTSKIWNEDGELISIGSSQLLRVDLK